MGEDLRPESMVPDVVVQDRCPDTLLANNEHTVDDLIGIM
jgi:hypothetical protein